MTLVNAGLEASVLIDAGSLFNARVLRSMFIRSFLVLRCDDYSGMIITQVWQSWAVTMKIQG